MSNLAKSQDKIKRRYYFNTECRDFHPGDSVLALLPMLQSPLQAKFCGPYKVKKRVGSVNYVIETPGRRKNGTYKPFKALS